MRSKHIYSDRFIPSRLSTKLDAGFGLTSDPPRRHGSNQRSQNNQNTDTTGSASGSSSVGSTQGHDANPKDSSVMSTSCASSSFSMLLKSELLGIDSPSHRPEFTNYTDYNTSVYPSSMGTSSSMAGNGCGIYNYSTSSARGGSFSSTSNGSSGTFGFPGRSTGSGSSNILRFKAPRQSIHDEIKTSISFNGIGCSSQRHVPIILQLRKENYALVMTTNANFVCRLLANTMNESRRKISKTPFKILDAPALQDDFYLNLVDWSSTNVLAVGLGSCVYLWSACTSKVTKLCDLGASDCVTSVAWSPRHKLAGHKQEVCGLKWSFDDHQLASGGNDNKLFVWNMHGASSSVSASNSSSASGTIPMVRFNDHTAAVKAIAWSPHQHGLLASGGGTADRCIRFWNTQTQTPINAIDTGSQVCNLMWSKNVNEVVSTHGYSLNQIIVWKYPSMTKLATLTGHTFRVLYLAMSPDGQTIVTGAGDETLRFWNAFPSSKSKGGSRLGTDLMLPIGMSNEIR
ncbi:Wd repeat-containing protein srw1, partial [Globisporangium splendens]